MNVAFGDHRVVVNRIMDMDKKGSKSASNELHQFWVKYFDNSVSINMCLCGGRRKFRSQTSDKILPRLFDLSWTSRDGPLRLGSALRVSNVAVQNASEKFHRSAGWWFQFCLFIILPSSGWLFHTSAGWLFHRSPVHPVILGPEMRHE